MFIQLLVLFPFACIPPLLKKVILRPVIKKGVVICFDVATVKYFPRSAPASSEIAKENKDQRQSPATEDEDEGDEELDFACGTDSVPSAIDGANAVQLLQRFFEFSDLPNADEALKMLSKIDAEINNIWVQNYF